MKPWVLVAGFAAAQQSPADERVDAAPNDVALVTCCVADACAELAPDACERWLDSRLAARRAAREAVRPIDTSRAVKEPRSICLDTTPVWADPSALLVFVDSCNHGDDGRERCIIREFTGCELNKDGEVARFGEGWLEVRWFDHDAHAVVKDVLEGPVEGTFAFVTLDRDRVRRAARSEAPCTSP